MDAAAPSEHQKTVLKIMLEWNGTRHSGRGGWSESTMRAMESRGWVRLVKVHVWEKDWELTQPGRDLASSLLQEKT